MIYLIDRINWLLKTSQLCVCVCKVESEKKFLLWVPFKKSWATHRRQNSKKSNACLIKWATNHLDGQRDTATDRPLDRQKRKREREKEIVWKLKQPQSRVEFECWTNPNAWAMSNTEERHILNIKTDRQTNQINSLSVPRNKIAQGVVVVWMGRNGFINAVDLVGRTTFLNEIFFISMCNWKSKKKSCTRQNAVNKTTWKRFYVRSISFDAVLVGVELFETKMIKAFQSEWHKFKREK